MDDNTKQLGYASLGCWKKRRGLYVLYICRKKKGKHRHNLSAQMMGVFTRQKVSAGTGVRIVFSKRYYVLVCIGNCSHQISALERSKQ